MADTGIPHIDLNLIFEELNARHFDGFLDHPLLEWNPRLRSSAGRFRPGRRPTASNLWNSYPCTIEIASYLLTEERGAEIIQDTMAHEMIHYWLWVRRKPYGHTEEFLTKMRLLGVSRYNPVPRVRPYKYLYRCGSCEKDFFARRRLGPLACAVCCKRHADGKYDTRFKLVQVKEFNRDGV